MMVTPLTRSVLAARRETRDLQRAGWEKVDDRGGRLWELDRGGRYMQVIKDVRISVTGKWLWVRIGEET